GCIPGGIPGVVGSGVEGVPERGRPLRRLVMLEDAKRLFCPGWVGSSGSGVAKFLLLRLAEECMCRRVGILGTLGGNLAGDSGRDMVDNASLDMVFVKGIVLKPP